MPRYKLTVEYDGGGLVGWQRQDNGPSVQAILEAAITDFCGVPGETVAAGRTDAGVHARGQVVHADLPKAYPPETVRDALNAHLRPAAVVVLSAAPVADDFHARFSAVGREYRYRIINRRTPLALDRARAWWVPAPLEVAAMAEAAQYLPGRHDFTSFRAAQCQARSPVKTLDRLDVAGDGDAILIDAAARSFLHHQMRNIVGSLRLVGEGRRPPGWIREVLAARDRRCAGPTAPAHGLTLMRVVY